MESLSNIKIKKINKDIASIVIDEPKDEFIAALIDINDYNENQNDIISYRNAQFLFTEQQMKIIKRTEFEALTIKGLSAETVEIDAKLDELDELVTYFFYYIDGGEQLYTIMAWALVSRKDVYREKVKKMIQTFNTSKNSNLG